MYEKVHRMQNSTNIYGKMKFFQPILLCNNKNSCPVYVISEILHLVYTVDDKLGPFSLTLTISIFLYYTEKNFQDKGK